MPNKPAKGISCINYPKKSSPNSTIWGIDQRSAWWPDFEVRWNLPNFFFNKFTGSLDLLKLIINPYFYLFSPHITHFLIRESSMRNEAWFSWFFRSKVHYYAVVSALPAKPKRYWACHFGCRSTNHFSVEKRLIARNLPDSNSTSEHARWRQFPLCLAVTWVNSNFGRLYIKR